MPQVIETKDGKVHTLFTDRDIVQLVYDYMGDDAEKCIREAFDRASLTVEEQDSDLDNYSATLESDGACFRDLLDTLTLLALELSKQRVNKSKALGYIRDMKRKINNQI